MSFKTFLFVFLFFFFQKFGVAQIDTINLSKNLKIRIDSIVESAIEAQAFPGCAIYVSVGDSVLINSHYGYHTYDSISRTKPNDLFDLASLTKVMGATLALMKLYEDGLLDLDARLDTYIKGLGWRKIGKVTIRECLSHQAGLQSWIRFYEEMKTRRGDFRKKTISGKISKGYGYQISSDLYLHEEIYKKVKKMIKRSPVNPDQGYKYSGLFFYLVPELVHTLTGTDYTQYIYESFYEPLGLDCLLFQPLSRYGIDEIVPTEIDTFFRHEAIHGMVHDEGAILMQGISGNAGLFGSLESTARLWKLFLKNGSLDSVSLLYPATLNLFTAYQYPAEGNRRALGFDKPLLEYDPQLSSVAKDVSVYSYGHTGYTGTLAWVDPKYDLVYIFLSNRVYPSRENKAIYELNVRPDIHQLIYDFILGQ